jgi:hypothetical protein
MQKTSLLSSREKGAANKRSKRRKKEQKRKIKVFGVVMVGRGSD